MEACRQRNTKGGRIDKEKAIRVLKEVKKDIEEDVAYYEGKPFTGKNVSECKSQSIPNKVLFKAEYKSSTKHKEGAKCETSQSDQVAGKTK